MSKKQVDLKEGINFGEYAIADAYEYHLDKFPGVWWRFKAVTSGMELSRSKFLLHNRVITTPEGVQYDQPPTSLEIAFRELALTCGGTNLERRNGAPAIPEGASVDYIENILAEFPPDLIRELWEELARLFPRWGAADAPPREVVEEEAVEEEEAKEEDPNS